MKLEDLQRPLSWAVYPRYVDHGLAQYMHTDVDLLTRTLNSQDARIAGLADDLEKAESALAKLERKKTELQNILAMSTNECTKNVAELTGKLNVLSLAIQEKEKTVAALQQQVEQLKAGKDAPPLPQDTLDKLTAYYSKYPEANIYSDAHYFGADKTKTADIMVQNWCTVATGFREFGPFLTGANAWTWRIAKEETGGDFHKACDLAVARVTRATPVNYVFDSVRYGVNDYWAFAHETHFAGFGDCDDYAVYRYVLCRTAGVPDLLMRIQNGNTRGTNDGHSTNAYYASTGGWRHVNSTTTFPATFTDVSQAPSIHDSSDAMGLAYTWYSYNSDKSWAGFVTDAQRQAFDKSRGHRLLRKVRIIPLTRGGSP